MRAPKVCLVPVLITTLTLVATGQTTNTQFGTAGINAIDADPKPCNSGGRAPDTNQDSANHPGPKAPDKKPIQPPSGGRRAVPANPNPVVIISSHSESRPLSRRDRAFEDLFLRMSVHAKDADDYEKLGKHEEAEQWRTYFQRMAGLNDAEGEVLQEIAHDCNCAMREQDAKLKAYNEKFPARYIPGVPHTTPPEFVQMFEYRKTIISDHVERLRLALGDSSFKKLEIKVLPMFNFTAPENGSRPTRPSTTGENTTENKQR